MKIRFPDKQAAHGLRIVLLILCMIFGGTAAFAQWTTQTITLHPGWNSVHLQVQPEPSDCDTLFAGLPIETAWGWHRSFSTVQFIQDPNNLIPGQPDWLVWAGASTQARPAVNLFHLLAEHSYLIKVPTNAAPVTWTVRGRPALKSAQWVPDSFNFLGLQVDPAAPPTFQDYFAPSPAHTGQPIFRMAPSGVWSQVNPASERPNPGEAYWVRCSGVSSYSGPLTLGIDQGRSMDYGRTLTEQTLTVANTSTNDRIVIVSQVPSGPPPSLSDSTLGGDVPLSSWVMNYPTQVGFVPLVKPLTNTVPAGGKWSLRLAVRRPDMAIPPAGAVNPVYQSLLQVKDGAGSLQLVPVTASGLMPPFSLSGSHPGLWVGTATINKVSNNLDQYAVTTPTNTASSFQFRLIVHGGTNGQANLLQHVFVAFKNGAGTNHFGANTNGNYVLVVNPAPPQTNLYDVIIRRFASAAFGFSTNVSMAQVGGNFGAAGSTNTATVILGYDDPANPFKHLYHPDHDNKGDDYNPLPVTANANWPGSQAVPAVGPYTSESWTVTRYASLQFTATDPENLTMAGWGDTMIGGYYTETITGLHRNPLYISGTFRLHLAVNAGSLN